MVSQIMMVKFSYLIMFCFNSVQSLVLHDTLVGNMSIVLNVRVCQNQLILYTLGFLWVSILVNHGRRKDEVIL